MEEKEKFRKNPINYAMRKTRLQKLLEIAQTNGEAERAEEVKTVREGLTDEDIRTDDTDRRYG